MAAGFQWQMAPARSSTACLAKGFAKSDGMVALSRRGIQKKIKGPLKNSVNLDLFRSADRPSSEMVLLHG